MDGRLGLLHQMFRLQQMCSWPIRSSSARLLLTCLALITSGSAKNNQIRQSTFPSLAQSNTTTRGIEKELRQGSKVEGECNFPFLPLVRAIGRKCRRRQGLSSAFEPLNLLFVPSVNTNKRLKLDLWTILSVNLPLSVPQPPSTAALCQSGVPGPVDVSLVVLRPTRIMR